MDRLPSVFYYCYTHTVYPKKYAHGFVVLCFVVVMQSFIMNSHEVFIHIHQGCFAGTGAIVIHFSHWHSFLKRWAINYPIINHSRWALYMWCRYLLCHVFGKSLFNMRVILQCDDIISGSRYITYKYIGNIEANNIEGTWCHFKEEYSYPSIIAVCHMHAMNSFVKDVPLRSMTFAIFFSSI